MCNNGKKENSCWNELEELKYLICAIDCCKCPDVPPPPSSSRMLPPRIQEVPCIPVPRRPICCPTPPCCPITPGPCCPCPLPPPPTKHSYRPTQPPPPCCPPSCPLPCYLSPSC